MSLVQTAQAERLTASCLRCGAAGAMGAGRPGGRGRCGGLRRGPWPVGLLTLPKAEVQYVGSQHCIQTPLNIAQLFSYNPLGAGARHSNRRASGVVAGRGARLYWAVPEGLTRQRGRVGGWGTGDDANAGIIYLELLKC